MVVDHKGHRKSKAVSSSKRIAEEVARKVELRLAEGDLGFFADPANEMPTFAEYSKKWLREYVSLKCKSSTKQGYEGILNLYVLPAFGSRRLKEIKRSEIKSFLAELGARNLASRTVNNTLAVTRGIFSYAVDDELLESNPAAKLGKSARSSATETDFKPIALSASEVAQFLESAKVVCPEYHPLFVLAVRAGLRRGELVAVRWGDFQFGADEHDRNRYVLVEHNYVKGKETTTKNRKTRRVDMSQDLRRILLEHREAAKPRCCVHSKQGNSASLTSWRFRHLKVMC